MNKINPYYFLPKLKNRVSSEKNRIWKYCNVNRISLCGFRPVMASGLKGCVGAILGSYEPILLKGVREQEIEAILSLANQTFRHQFNLLGSGIVTLIPIDWHTDFKSDKRWEKKYYRELKGKTGADIKVPWELSRCQHLLWLGEAYLLTREKRYAQEIIDDINWWIDDNPLMYSVNWACSMDVAFRAVNWMYALNMIAGFEGFDDEFANKVSRSLWQHGFFIRNNLEKQIPYSNNHYASDIVGLLYIGALFRHTRRGKKWFQFALKEYYNEVRQQVLPSGLHYERSVSYHRLMTELLSYPVYMLKRIGVDVPSDIHALIQGMYAYIANYTKPNGYAPLIADNDDGRFVPFLKRNFREHNYLNDERSVENRFITSGMEVLFHSVAQQSKVYSDAGFAILRNDNAYLFVSNGGYSKHPEETDVTIGTHTHNDLLSFELNVGGNDVIVDPGTFLYTSSPLSRNEFRSTKKHNTIVVDDEEQNGLIDSFVVKRNVSIGDLTQENNTVTGEYKTIQGGMMHIRSFSLIDDSVIITDTITKQGNNHKGKLYFHFAKGIYPEIEGRKIRLQVRDSIIEIETLNSSIFIKDDTISPSFGVVERSKTAECLFDFSEKTTIKTVIKWKKISNTK